MTTILTTRARALRKNATKAENHLWHLLRNRHLSRYKFRRQYVIPPYIVDFICIRKKIIIELDGGHHMETRTQCYDSKRTTYLNSKGYKILRFWNDDVVKQTESVLIVIMNALEMQS